MVRELFDIVVLSVGMEISPETRALAEKIGVDLTSGGFVKTSSFDPVATSKPGIFVCGAVQGPKDIPQSVVEAGGAAMSGALHLQQQNTLTKKAPDEVGHLCFIRIEIPVGFSDQVFRRCTVVFCNRSVSQGELACGVFRKYELRNQVNDGAQVALPLGNCRLAFFRTTISFSSA